MTIATDETGEEKITIEQILSDFTGLIEHASRATLVNDYNKLFGTDYSIDDVDWSGE